MSNKNFKVGSHVSFKKFRTYYGVIVKISKKTAIVAVSDGFDGKDHHIVAISDLKLEKF